MRARRLQVWLWMIPATILVLAGSACTSDRSSGGSEGGEGAIEGEGEGEGQEGEGEYICLSDFDCPAKMPRCDNGLCTERTAEGEGEGAEEGEGEGATEGEGDGRGEGEGEGAAEGEGEGVAEGEGEGGGEGAVEGEGEGQTSEGGLCDPCSGRDQECGDGVNDRCLGYNNGKFYCSKACGGPEDCPTGFLCFQLPDGPAQCVPQANFCEDNCAVAGCASATDVCNVETGVCMPARLHCETCNVNEECADQHCVALGSNTVCLKACPAGNGCPASATCQERDGAKLCIPENETCDLCSNSACVAPAAICDPLTGECVACLADADCASRGPGLVCVARACVPRQGENCRSHDDCLTPAAPKCLAGTCVGCIIDEDCGIQQSCNPDTNFCIRDLCRGVNCGNQGLCDERTGRCAPGCNADADCGAERKCDVQYGICYNANHTCDDLTSPCRPGVVCGGLGADAFCQCPFQLCGPQADGSVLTCPPPAVCNQFTNTCDFNYVCHTGQFCMLFVNFCSSF